MVRVCVCVRERPEPKEQQAYSVWISVSRVASLLAPISLSPSGGVDMRFLTTMLTL